MRPSVFISHSSADRDIAGKLCAALERRGLSCWLSSRDIGPGENFQEAIVTAIRSARTMVLVFTGNANNSSEIKKELALASQNHLVVIPLRAEDVVPGDAFLYEFSTRQWIDAFDDWERAVGRLAEQIGGLIGNEDLPPAPPPDATARGRQVPPRHARALVLAAGVAALAAAGGLAYWHFGHSDMPRDPSPATSAAKHDISGKWVTGPLVSPYARNQTSTLFFEFQQSGEMLFGTVREKSNYGGALKGIQGGQIKGDVVVFHTLGATTDGNVERPYKDNYRGTIRDGEIAFVRQNDVPSGGLPVSFTAKRQ